MVAPAHPQTQPTPSTDGLSAATAAGMQAEIAALFADDNAPPDPVPSPTRAPSPTADAAPADDSGAAESEATRAPAKETPAPTQAAPPEAPVLPKTRAELDALLAEETKRQRADQSRLARELEETRRQLRQTQLESKGREGAIAQIIEKYGGTEVESEAYRQWLQGNTWAQEEHAKEQQQSTQAVQAAQSLGADKQRAALSLWSPHERPLVLEAGALGLTETDLDAIIEQVKQTDPGVVRLGQKFMAARTIEDACEFAEAGYTLLDERVRAALQAKKLESLKEPDEKPRPARTQHFGGAGATNSDPFAHIQDLEKRAAARLREGMDRELANFWQQE